MKKSNRGFTLIELLTVIAIIGILSGIVYASLDGARAKSRDNKRIADISELRLSLALYLDANNKYPASLNDLVSANLIPAVPVGPSNDPYYYAAIGSGSPCVAYNYHIGATLERNDPELAGDADYTSTSASLCSSPGSGFDGREGVDVYVYDVKK